MIRKIAKNWGLIVMFATYFAFCTAFLFAYTNGMYMCVSINEYGEANFELVSIVILGAPCVAYAFWEYVKDLNEEATLEVEEG